MKRIEKSFLDKIKSVNKTYARRFLTKWKVIDIPNNELKELQSKFLKEYLRDVWDYLPSYISWWIKWRNVFKTAKVHVWSKIIMKLDLSNFFMYWNRKRIHWLMKNYFNLDDETSDILTDFFISSYWTVAKWSPTTPILLILLARWIDVWIQRILNEDFSDYWFTYNRYYDDMTIWFKAIPSLDELKTFIKKVYVLIEKEWFLMNTKKTKNVQDE